jgi:signal transduction histidine kinase/ActR/RegA family two-component response regulator
LNTSGAGIASEVALEEIISTDELARRPTRAPDHAAENRALSHLAGVLAHTPRDILQTLTDEALSLCRAGSAGISIIESAGEEPIFRWHALSGTLRSHLWGTTPRHFSPCGTVVDRNRVLLMSHLERHFRYFAEVRPQIVEALLIPFNVDGQIIGTVWVVMHDEAHRFDLEDVRLMQNLANFAAAAYQIRRALQISQESDRQKDEFLATVAHELRNPLSALHTATHYAQIRLRGMAEPQLQAINDMGVRQLKSMSRLVDDLLDVARIRLDKLDLRKERVAIHEILRQAADTCRTLIDAGRHQFTLSLPDEPLWVQGDCLRLTQIVTNLLTNAAKYTPAEGRITLSAARQVDSAVICVRDSGIGISESMLPRIFELFAQSDRARTRAQGGLGIGLTVVRRLVELHAGSVSARSAGEGAGSEFVVTLPLDRDESAVINGPSSAQSGSVAARPLPTLRILVVDDNQDSADSLALLLSAHGHDVRTAYDGPSALEVARTFKPQVALQDIAMPGMDGFEIARRLRDIPPTQKTALIALTGFSSEKDACALRAAGFDHQLTKPLDFDDLQRLLQILTFATTLSQATQEA